MAEVVWSEQALQDLDSLAEYVSQDSVLQANRLVQGIFNRVKILEKQAHAGHPVKELPQEGMKEVLWKKYRIIYQIASEKKVYILTVHHSKRLLRNNPRLRK